MNQTIKRTDPNPKCDVCMGEGLITSGVYDDIASVPCVCTIYDFDDHEQLTN